MLPIPFYDTNTLVAVIIRRPTPVEELMVDFGAHVDVQQPPTKVMPLQLVCDVEMEATPDILRDTEQASGNVLPRMAHAVV